jgi:hypothetical protein
LRAAEAPAQTQTQQELELLIELIDTAAEHRHEKLELQKRVWTLEQDLLFAKQVCKDQEYHITQVADGDDPGFKEEW